jgi:hypothetical protein
MDPGGGLVAKTEGSKNFGVLQFMARPFVPFYAVHFVQMKTTLRQRVDKWCRYIDV